MKNSIKKFITLSLAAALITSCAREISPDVYTADCIGEASETYQGTICNARCVKVEEFERMEDHQVGALAGGVAGGAAGASIGKGTGQVAAAAGGALAGLIGGAFLEKKIRSQRGVEYIVQLDNGNLLTVVQGKNPPLSVGQRVFVMVSHEGRSRVIPQNNG
jgi:outer membrane lipoprotein SlyB